MPIIISGNSSVRTAEPSPEDAPATRRYCAHRHLRDIGPSAVPRPAIRASKSQHAQGTRAKSSIVLSLMIDGSGSRACWILGRLRPVRNVRKRGAMPHQSARRDGWQIVL